MVQPSKPDAEMETQEGPLPSPLSSVLELSKQTTDTKVHLSLSLFLSFSHFLPFLEELTDTKG